MEASTVFGEKILNGGRPEAGDCWMMMLSSKLTITTSNEESFSVIGKRPEELFGQRLDRLLRLGVLLPLISRGVCFRDQPLWIKGRKFFCDFSPVESKGQPAGGMVTILRREQVSDPGPEIPDMFCTSGPVQDLSRESLILVNREGIITLINQPFADVLGIRAQEMIGRHVHLAYPNSHPSRLPVVMDSGQTEVAEPHLLNGRHAVVSRYPLLKDGDMIGALGKVLFPDIREIKVLANKFQAYFRTAEAPPAKSGGHQFRYDCNSIIGQSPVIMELKAKLLRIAQKASNVLLVGESGTGKELFAHALHAASRRRYAPFVRVNCAAIPEQLIEAELFGYTDGAFTGAKKGGQIGKFEAAHNGTIFLDEISEMPSHMQAKLLRVLQEKEVTPLGGSVTKRIDVRVVAATNIDLRQQVQEGRFRADLFYRLNIVALDIPALRERREDIPVLANHLIDHFNAEFEMAIEGLDEEAWEALRNYRFPGNIRELSNVIESAFNVTDGPLIHLSDLPPNILEVSERLLPDSRPPAGTAQLATSLGSKSLQEIMDEVERLLIEQSLEKVGGNKLNAAHLLGISRPGLYKKLQKYRLH